MGGNNGNGTRTAASPGVLPRTESVPWEQVRSLVWHAALNTDLAQCAGAVRFQDGEHFKTGYSEAKLITSIDLQKLLSRLSREIGVARTERFFDFCAGIPPDRFGGVERVQLRQDVLRMAHFAHAGGYGGWISLET